MKTTSCAAKIIALIMALFLISSVASVPVYAASAPAAPSKVSATRDLKSIKLTWSAVKGATGYRIYYKQPTDKSWRTGLKSTTKTTHTFKNLPQGKTYRFAVRSYITEGKKTVWGKYKEISTATLTPAPAKLTVTQSTSAVKLTWSAVKSASGYRIYYKTSASADWKTGVSSTTKTTHTFKKLPAGKKYYFAVRTYTKSAFGTFYGNYASVQTATKPATTTAKITKATSTAVALSWKKVTADGYRVYYKVGSGAWKTAVSSTTKTSCTIKNLSASKSYSFAVRPYVKTSSGIIWGDYKAISHRYKSNRIDRYAELFESGTFLMTINDPEMGPLTMALKGNKMYIEASSDGLDQKMIYRGDIKSKEDPTQGTWFLVLDAYKVYSVIPADVVSDTSVEELIEDLKNGEEQTYTTSTEKLNGKTYYVESCVDKDGTKTKYYFDGDVLVRSDSISPDGTVTTTEFSKITGTVPDSLFVIPSSYTQADLYA